MQSEVSSGQQVDMVTDAAQEQHLCLDCRADISRRGRGAKRCEPCSKVRNRQRANNNYWENRTKVLQRIKRQQQTPEYKQSRHQWEKNNPEKLQEYRGRSKQKRREETGYNPEGRTCEKCDAAIPIDRGHRAKRCVSCSTPPPRKCKVCPSDISGRGARAQFCSPECKVQYGINKELAGYIKTCTKCNEAKEHTEFGLHNKLRRSVCKICEVHSTREYYQSLPVEERQQRRRIHGQRERAKKDSLSPEQKAILRTKARKAHRRKLYGPDFDEDRLYSEQEGKCAICGIRKSLEELKVDHDHEAGRPWGFLRSRGFLCTSCNFKLLPRYEKFPPERQDSERLNTYLSKGEQQ